MSGISFWSCVIHRLFKKNWKCCDWDNVVIFVCEVRGCERDPASTADGAIDMSSLMGCYPSTAWIGPDMGAKLQGS